MRAIWIGCLGTLLLAACARPGGDAPATTAAPAATVATPVTPVASPALTVAVLTEPGADSPFRWEPVLADGQRTRVVDGALFAPAAPIVELLQPGARVALEGARLRVDDRVLDVPVRTIDGAAWADVAVLARIFGALAYRHPDDGAVALWPAPMLQWLAANGDPRAPVLLRARAEGLVGPAGPATPAATPQLRVRNVGPHSAQALRVQFPDALVDFGDVPTGATTEYRAVAGGIYNYAAYRLRSGGRDVSVPVIDWVGEVPLPGAAYTYVVAVDPDAELVVTLVRVERDR